MPLAATQQSKDIEFAADFLALNTLLEACSNGEKVALLLSTCRNAYLTVNAIFVDLQLLLGGEGQSLRGAAELLMRGDAKRANELLGRASQTFNVMETKSEVWRTREELHAQVEASLSLIAKSDSLAADRVRLMLGSVRSPSGQLIGGWYDETLAFDLRHREHLNESLVVLDRVGKMLGSCIALGRLVATSSIAQRQGSLQLFDHADGDGLCVSDAVELLAENCDWKTVLDGDDIVVEPLIARKSGIRPQSNQARIPCRLSIDNVEYAQAGAGSIIRDAMYLAHEILNSAFEPNVAQRPMPDPFVIKLPPEARTLPPGGVRELNVQRVRCRSRNSPRDHVRIAIANLAVPEAELDDYRIKEEKAAAISRDVHVALREASRQNCQAVVFPEYSIPKTLRTDLLAVANELCLIIVGGMEGDWKGDRLADSALVAIPGETELHYQFKQEPSLYEENGAAFFRNGIVKIFSGSSIGDFAVTVCSDWLETTTMKAWSPEQLMPEVHIIVARNNFVDLYRNFALADSMRLYAAVVVANVCESNGESCNEGSCVVVPHRKQPELEGVHVDVPGAYCSSLSVFDLNLRAIRARSRGKPEEGFFPVPKSAQRILGDKR